MTGKPEDKASSFPESIENAKSSMEQVVVNLQKNVDGVLKEAATQLVASGTVVVNIVKDGVTIASQYADEGKAVMNQGLSHLKAAEDVAVAELKGGLDFIQSTPYVSYPLLATGTLLLLPGTRRLLYRATLGRLRSAENIIKGSEGKVEALRVKLTDFENEAKKLQERMQAAEEEFVRGRAKLKATRQELQRLASVVSKSERAATGVLEDLRAVKKVDKATELRAEAALQVRALRDQRSALQAYIYRIASKDV